MNNRDLIANPEGVALENEFVFYCIITDQKRYTVQECDANEADEGYKARFKKY